MSVLIKGMEMPKNCASCNIEQELVDADETGLPYIGAHRCPLVYPSYTDKNRYEGLLPNCPLVPVPPHGRLKDADAMFKDICDSINGMTAIGVAVDGQWLWGKLNDALENASTIIPAEEGE